MRTSYKLIGLAGFAALIFSASSCGKSEEGHGEHKGHGQSGLRDGLMNEGEAAPTITFKSLTGGEFSLEAFKGKPVVLNFFASWCKPCNNEAGALQRSFEAFGKDIGFAGIAVQDTPEGARKFVSDHKITYAVAVDGGEISSAYRVYGLPKTIVIGRDGKVAFMHTGEMTEETLAREIKARL